MGPEGRSRRIERSLGCAGMLAGKLLFYMAVIPGRWRPGHQAGVGQYVSWHDGQVCNSDCWIHFNFKQCQASVTGGIVLRLYPRSGHDVGRSILGVTSTEAGLSAAEIEKFFQEPARYQAARDIRKFHLVF